MDCLRDISRFLYPSSPKDSAFDLFVKADKELDVHERNHFYSDMIINDLCSDLCTTEKKLYDILYEVPVLPRWRCESFEYLRSALEDYIRRNHSYNMSSAFAAIERRRIRASFCSGGCTGCSANLPLSWPTSEGHNGFCSPACLSTFNSKLSHYSKIDLSKESIYTCCYRYCKNKIDWVDLETYGSDIFCGDMCECDKYDQDRDDDIEWERYEMRNGR
jgi:hypothetical protein